MSTQNQSYADETSENDFSEQEIKFRGNKQQTKVQKQVKETEKAASEQKKPSRSNFHTRTIYTLMMLFGFFGIIAAGPIYSVLFITVLSFLMFDELLRLKRRKDKEQQIPLFHLINWYFFTISVYFSLGKMVQAKLPDLIFSNETINFMNKFHNVIFFLLWSAGFVIFTLSLKPGFYRYQIRQFGWTHIGCFFLVGSISLISQNIFEGLIWFLLPATLVIANDIFAYIFGFFLGKTKLIALSPKKTWEGFIGGAVCSVVWAFLISTVVTYIPQLICPQKSVQIIPFQFQQCTFPEFFNYYDFELPSFLHAIGLKTIKVNDFSSHAVILSLFASLIAPFGGFFASGLKRALKIKDFGDVIPGHGGLIDRFDCQLIMGMFAYVYLHSIVLQPGSTIGQLYNFIDSLPYDEQLSIYQHLQQNLNITQGIQN